MMIAVIFAAALVQAPPPAVPAAQAAPPGATPAVPTQGDAPAITEIRTAAGALVARAMIWQARGGIEVRVQAAGLAPGHYGAHFHAVGRCEGPAFASAGAHWNPTGRQHGSLNPQGHHLGDLPNLDVDEHGAGRLEFLIAGASTSGAGGLLDADGTALVIHAAADDYRTDPSGNSGARHACGTFQANQATP
jgi:Cu-Zn family superoxide dismutase